MGLSNTASDLSLDSTADKDSSDLFPGDRHRENAAGPSERIIKIPRLVSSFDSAEHLQSPVGVPRDSLENWKAIWPVTHEDQRGGTCQASGTGVFTTGPQTWEADPLATYQRCDVASGGSRKFSATEPCPGARLILRTKWVRHVQQGKPWSLKVHHTVTSPRSSTAVP